MVPFHRKGGEIREALRCLGLYFRQHLVDALFLHVGPAHVAAQHVKRQLHDRGAVQLALIHQLGDALVQHTGDPKGYACSWCQVFQWVTA